MLGTIANFDIRLTASIFLIVFMLFLIGYVLSGKADVKDFTNGDDPFSL